MTFAIGMERAACTRGFFAPRAHAAIWASVDFLAVCPIWICELPLRTSLTGASKLNSESFRQIWAAVAQSKILLGIQRAQRPGPAVKKEYEEIQDARPQDPSSREGGPDE